MQTQTTETPVPRIVIIGGGAGGLELATKLGRKLGKRSKARITLIDQFRVHVWKPLLHEVATGSLDTEIDGVVYRAHAKRHHYQFQLGQVIGVDRERQEVIVAPIEDEKGQELVPERRFSYDTLVFAIGSVSNDFGTPGVAEHCYFLDSKHQAARFQQRLQNLMLKASAAEQGKIRLAVVGAGATGVELSAELNHVIEALSIYDRQKGSKPDLHIDLIEAGERILPALPERIAESAAKELQTLGVEIHTNTKITRASETGFEDANNNQINADILVWAAGVKAQSWVAKTGLKVNRTNQLLVEPTLKSSSDEHIWVIGDCCHLLGVDGNKIPPRAQAAHQMASTAASNIIRELAHKPLRDFEYKDYGSLVNLSRFSTVGSLMGNLVRGSMFIEGRIARVMYLSLYRMHQLAIHGPLRGLGVIFLSRLSKIIRPKIKLH